MQRKMCQLQMATLRPSTASTTATAVTSATPTTMPESESASIAALLALSHVSSGTNPASNASSRKRPCPCLALSLASESELQRHAGGGDSAPESPRCSTPHANTGDGVSKADKRFKTRHNPLRHMPPTIKEEDEDTESASTAARDSGGEGDDATNNTTAPAHQQANLHTPSPAGDDGSSAATTTTPTTTAAAVAHTAVTTTTAAHTVLAAPFHLLASAACDTDPSPATTTACMPRELSPHPLLGTPSFFSSANSKPQTKTTRKRTRGTRRSATLGAAQASKAGKATREDPSALALMEAKVDAATMVVNHYQQSLQLGFEQAKAATTSLGVELRNLRHKKGVLVQHMTHMQATLQPTQIEPQRAQSLTNYISLVTTVQSGA